MTSPTLTLVLLPAEVQDVSQCLSMKPSKLKPTSQQNILLMPTKGDSIFFFFFKKDKYLHQQQLIKCTASIPEKALWASFLAAYWIAKSKRSHTVGEELLSTSMFLISEVRYDFYLSLLTNSLSLLYCNSNLFIFQTSVGKTEWNWIQDPFCSEAREHCVLSGRAEE